MAWYCDVAGRGGCWRWTTRSTNVGEVRPSPQSTSAARAYRSIRADGCCGLGSSPGRGCRQHECGRARDHPTAERFIAARHARLHGNRRFCSRPRASIATTAAEDARGFGPLASGVRPDKPAASCNQVRRPAGPRLPHLPDGDRRLKCYRRSCRIRGSGVLASGINMSWAIDLLIIRQTSRTPLLTRIPSNRGPPR